MEIKNWKFFLNKENIDDFTNINSEQWEEITIPHTWNTVKTQSGNRSSVKEDTVTSYLRCKGFYLNKTFIEENTDNSCFILRFNGVSSKCWVYVNDVLAVTHKGGYTAFDVDITDLLHFNAENKFFVCVSNEYDETIAPLTTDFKIYGGIYRDVTLEKVPAVHFVTDEFCSSPLILLTYEVNETQASMFAKSIVKNSLSKDVDIFVKTTMGDGYEIQRHIHLEAKQEVKIREYFPVNNPHFWNGRKDPFLYTVTAEIIEEGKLIQKISDKVGFKYISVSKQFGFYLNGSKYLLRGVSRCEEGIPSVGNALTDEQQEEDFAILNEIGANVVRLSHNPQNDYFYSLCDKYGILVWSDFPLTGEIGGKGSYENPDETRKAFFDNTKRQMQEAIYQLYNHASITFWGIQNGIKNDQNDVMKNFVSDLTKTCTLADNDRMAAQAVGQQDAQIWDSDVIGFNYYPSRRGLVADEFKEVIGEHMKLDERPLGISEYGIKDYENYLENMEKANKNGDFLFEKRQCYYHERFLKIINIRKHLFCTFTRNLFDISTDGKDDGLVSVDRKIKKDAFYFYKANWSKEPVTYIASKRYMNNKKGFTAIKVYSNENSVSLYVNDKKISKKRNNHCNMPCTFIFRMVKINKGENIIKAVGENSSDEFNLKI
ncbi:MAG: glycoside hydrolase family 2 TIM barrel-domain containing protein [Oscillospiraceae bacterium]